MQAPFQESFYVLITMSLLILAGNTWSISCRPPNVWSYPFINDWSLCSFPVFLRLIIWTLYGLCPDNSTFFNGKKETLKFLLDHPRRCYPYLFRPRDTWWLAAVVVTLNGIDWAAFEILNVSISSPQFAILLLIKDYRLEI